MAAAMSRTTYPFCTMSPKIRLIFGPFLSSCGRGLSRRCTLTQVYGLESEAKTPWVLSRLSTEEGIDCEHKLRKRLVSNRLAPLQGADVLIAVRGGMAVHLQAQGGYALPKSFASPDCLAAIAARTGSLQDSIEAVLMYH